MATRMQQRRGTAAQWTAANPTLAAGEIGFETDNNRFKIGDGVTAWGSLDYFANSAALSALIDGAPDLLNTLGELAQSLGDDPDFLGTMTTMIQETGTDLAAHEQTLTNVHGIADTSLLVTVDILSAHNNETENVHGIDNTAELITQTQLSTAVDNHNDATTNVHGIDDTSLLATTSDISDHAAVTLNVHGIANTALLATQEYADEAAADAADAAVITAGTAADDKISVHNLDETNVHGIADTAALATMDYADTAVSTAVAALTKSSVGLPNVDNTADVDKPVSTATQTELDLKAPLANPTFTGTVSGVTKTHVGLGNVDNTSDADKPVSTAQASAIATAKDEAIAAVNDVIASAPAALNTLDELAAALGDDANFATTVTNNLAAKAPLANPTFTGTVTVAANGVAFTDGTQTKAGVPSITSFATAISSSATLASGEQDKFVPLTGAVTITLPASGYSTGQSIDFYQASGTGAQFSNANSTVGTPGLKLRTTNSVATAMKTSSGWLVFGDLSA